MIKKNLLSILFLVAVIAMSGCLGDSSSQEEIGALPGVIITNAQSDFTEIDARETTSFSVEFENRGDATASNILGELVRKGSFLVEDVYVADAVPLEEPIEGVYAGDEFVWDLTAPGVTQDRIEEVQARIYYDYETEGFATINFVPRDIIREQGQESFPIDSYTTAGPIEIDVVASQPVIIRPDELTSTSTSTSTCTGTSTTFDCDNTLCWDDTNTDCGLTPDCAAYCHVTDINDKDCGRNACSTFTTESECTAAPGCTPQTTTQGAADKTVRINILLYNVWNGRVESTDDTAMETTACNNKGLDCIDSIEVTATGANCQVTEVNGEAPAGAILVNEPGIKLVQGQQASKTYAMTFALTEVDAATSCQLNVKADYRYRVDSSVLPITVKKPL